MNWRDANRQVVSSDDEQLILVDIHDREIGFLAKADAHRGSGSLHRAFSLFVFNPASELLVQQRANGKRLWPGYWSNSCCSHPRRGETMHGAIHRRLREELALRAELKFLFKFVYHAQYGRRGAEYEMCWVYAGDSAERPQPNANEIAACATSRHARCKPKSLPRPRPSHHGSSLNGHESCEHVRGCLTPVPHCRGCEPNPSARRNHNMDASEATHAGRPATVTVDRDGIIRQWDSAVTELVGHTADDAIGRSLDIVIPPIFRSLHWWGFDRAMKSGQMSGDTLKLLALCKDGRIVVAHMAIDLIPAKGGGADGAVVTFFGVGDEWEGKAWQAALAPINLARRMGRRVRAARR